MEKQYKTPDAEFVAWLIKAECPDSDITPEWVEANGFGYAFTELTPEEAEQLGARAYLRRRK